jgi:regulator of replication initiation timing
MSRTIQEALDLPTLEDLLKAPRETDEGEIITDEMLEEAQANNDVEQLTHALGNNAVAKVDPDEIEAKDHADNTDDIFGQTLQHAQDLMDLGYNVDTRSSGKIFETAATMYKIALDAKNAKRDAQLKNKKLKLENDKLRAMLGQKTSDDIVESEAVVIADRNDMIKRLREQK